MFLRPRPSTTQSPVQVRDMWASVGQYVFKCPSANHTVLFQVREKRASVGHWDFNGPSVNSTHSFVPKTLSVTGTLISSSSHRVLFQVTERWASVGHWDFKAPLVNHTESCLRLEREVGKCRSLCF